MKVGVVALVTSLALAGTTLANLITNSGFATEGSGGAQDAADWTEASSSGRENWGDHDSDGYLMAAYGYTTGSTTAQFYQDITGASEGYTYTLSYWHEGDSGWNGSAVSVSLIWLDSGGSSIGTPVSNDLQSYYAESWSNRILSGVAPAGTATVRVEIDATKLDSGGAGAQKFDQFDLVAIPEPATLSLFGLAFAGLLGLHRRARH